MYMDKDEWDRGSRMSTSVTSHWIELKNTALHWFTPSRRSRSGSRTLSITTAPLGTSRLNKYIIDSTTEAYLFAM